MRDCPVIILQAWSPGPKPLTDSFSYFALSLDSSLAVVVVLGKVVMACAPRESLISLKTSLGQIFPDNSCGFSTVSQTSGFKN